MLPLLLAVLAVVGEPDHARFHPAQPDVYVEVPDLAAALKAYEAAPMVRTMRDPAVAKIADMATQMGFDIRATIEGALPVADPNRPDDRFWPWSAARVVSMSVEGLDAPSATGTASAGANTAENAVRDMGARTRGWIVADFVDASAAQQAVLALGSTGGVTKVSIEGDAPLDLNGRKLPITRLELSAFGTRVPMWLASDGSRLLAGTGLATPEELTRRLGDASTSFASRRDTAMNDEGLAPAKGTVIARAWSDLERLASAGDQGALSNTLIDTFLPSLLPFVGQKGRYRLQLDGDRFVTETLVERIGPARELDALYGAGPIAPSTTRLVAAEATGAWVMKIQPAAFESMMGRILTQSNVPAAPDDARPIAPTLGEGAAMFMMPYAVANVTGGDALPNVVMSVELRDAAAFEAALGPWIERARKAQPKLTVESKPYRKLPMYTFGLAEESTEAGAREASMRPTLTILPDRVLLTTNRKNAQSEVRRLDGKPTEVHPLANEGALPKDAYEAGSMDWGGMFSKLYEAAKGFLPMVAQQSEKPIDVNALPSTAELFRFFKPSTSYSRRVDGRTYTYSESSFGPETPMGLGLVGLVMGTSGEQRIAPANPTREASASEPASKPVSEAPVVPAERTATIASMKTVKIGISLYKSQFDRVPATLDELLKPTDAFQNGFVESAALLKDGWGRPLVYAAAADSRKFELRSMGPNGVDDRGAVDDVTLAP